MMDKNSLKGRVTPAKAAYHAEILANRVKKRYKHLAKRFRKQHIDCFRLYDWDIPEVRAVVDWYAGHLVIAEYERQQTSDKWLETVARGTAHALSVPDEKVHLKRRRTQADERNHYQQMASTGQRLCVQERDLEFWVNLDDFLDTGLYSDHRNTRLKFRDYVSDGDFLNLFAYTGTFTCAAGRAGARSTVTVDRSQTNIDWARDNLKLNGFDDKRHHLQQADVFSYLQEVSAVNKQFDCVFVDPPSFYRQSGQTTAFDVNRDHVRLLKLIRRCVRQGGHIVFSTNHQRFEPRLQDLTVNEIIEWTPQSIPEDYRNRHVHRCWLLKC
jgi:23S rRNA (cytosine1962-C5)-methyltransferase